MKKKTLLLLFAIPALVLGACSKGNKSSSEVIDSSSSNDDRGSSSLVSSSSDNPSSSSLISSSNPQSSSNKGSSSSDTPGSDPSLTEFEVEFSPFINKERSFYNIRLTYSDNYFLTDPDTYDKDLSLLSYGASVVTGSKEDVDLFFTPIKFDNVVYHDYYVVPTAETVGHTFAHKEINGYHVIAIVVRGFEYGMEWANNFEIGYSGNHEGFNKSANTIYSHLKDYLSDKSFTSNLKLWLTGYSRGGAIANVLADTIIRNDELDLYNDKLYAYTFEAPRGLDASTLQAYPFVHNIINNNDVVANIPPASYGLGRCGVDYPIYDENVSMLMSDYDDGAVIAEYTPVTIDGTTYNTETELVAHLLDHIFNNQSASAAEYTANNRAEYVDRYQDGLSHLIGYVFALKEETRQSLITDLKNASFFDILGYLSSGESLATFLETYLDRDNISYNHELLASDCQVALNAISYLFNELFTLYLNSSYKPILMRLLAMHYPEVTYVLLQSAHERP